VRGLRAVRARSFLCAGCRDGEGQGAPVQAKWSPTPVLTEKHNGFDTSCLRRRPWVQSAPERPQRDLREFPKAAQRDPKICLVDISEDFAKITKSTDFSSS